MGTEYCLKCDRCMKELHLGKSVFIQNQIDLMIAYAQMMLDRRDWHGLWDAAIDLQRLYDKLKYD